MKNGASILTFWETILAPRADPGGPFGTSGPPWRTMGAAGWSRAGSLLILFDFGMILRLVYIRFLNSKTLKLCLFVSGLVSKSFRYGFLNRNFDFGTSKSCFSQGRYCKNRFIMELVFNKFQDRCLLIFERLGNCFLFFLALKTSLKTQRFLVI